MEEKRSSQEINGVETIGQRKLQPKFHTLYKNELEMDNWPECKPRKLLSENIEDLQDLGLG